MADTESASGSVGSGSIWDFENAVEARLEAEKNIYGEFLELYHEWEKKSSDDPEWARRHPFSVSVPVPK